MNLIRDIKNHFGNTILCAKKILEHRPNLLNKMHQSFKKYNFRKDLPHDWTYGEGFYDGYKYACERLEKHDKNV